MRHDDKTRKLIAHEAARLMYEEGIKEYRDAKRKAAKKFGPEKALSLGSHLPSNAEVHDELQRLISLYEADVLPERLMRMRLLALKYMEMLEPFSPRLVGSVLSGVVTSVSDIDIHLFVESTEEVEEHLSERGIPFDVDVVTIHRGGEYVEYPHIYMEEDDTIIECSIYPPGEIHRRPISSITGRPMERADMKKLRKIISETAHVLLTDQVDAD